MNKVLNEATALQLIDVANQFALERESVKEVVITQQSRLWIWRPANAIVLTSRERELASSSIAHSFATQGWPVVVRDCGGGPVALGPACLNVSWLMPLTGAMSIEGSYKEFCQPLINALRNLGIQAEWGALPGSYCDGKFNLLVAGRKLAGTSQRVYRTATGVVRLSHAVLHVLTDVADQLAKLNEFLKQARNAGPLLPHHLISMVDLMPGVILDAVFQSVSDAIEKAFTASSLL